MADNEYVYAVARIRTKELSLLTSQSIEQLMACKTYDDCLHFLADKGWDYADGSAEKMLTAESEKTWELIGGMVDGMSVFDVFLYANDFHNLKAAVKQVCTQSNAPDIYIKHGTVKPELIIEAVKAHDFARLPEKMRSAGKEAFDTLLHTHDGQFCDVIIDKAALEAIYSSGMDSDNEVIKKYAELTVASADIKIAVRAAKTGKNIEFLNRALADCGTLDLKRLARASVGGIDSIIDYLEVTPYSGAADSIKESLSAFERWCDNQIIEYIRPQKYNPFGIAPLAAYILARDNEIKTVRIILSGKLNGFPDEFIRERLRDMYV